MTRGHLGQALGQALRSREFRLLCILYFSFLFSNVAVSVHLVIHATGLGIPATRAALTLSLIGGACIIGMNVMGNLADRFSNRVALGISYAVMALSLFWLIPSGSEWSLFLFSIAFGFAYGGMQVLFSPLVAEVFGTRSHGVILAAAALAGSVGAALGPIVAGYIFDVLGSYTGNRSGLFFSSQSSSGSPMEAVCRCSFRPLWPRSSGTAPRGNPGGGSPGRVRRCGPGPDHHGLHFRCPALLYRGFHPLCGPGADRPRLHAASRPTFPATALIAFYLLPQWWMPRGVSRYWRI